MSNKLKFGIGIAAWGACAQLSVVLWLFAPNNNDDNLHLNFFTVGAGLCFFLAMVPFFISPLLLLKRPNPAAIQELQRRAQAHREKEAQELATWPRGRATVRRATDLGARENDSIRARCELEVAAGDFRATPYRVMLELWVPPLGFARLIPNGSVPVVINPNNGMDLTILWDEP